MKQSKQPSLYIYGWHSVKAALLNPNRQVMKIIVSKNKKNDFENKIRILINKNIEIKFLNQQKFVSLEKKDLSSQGIMALAKKVSYKKIELFYKQNTGILLDGITDPQNIGAIIRSAVAFNIKSLVQTKKNSCTETTLLNKASTGCIDKLNLYQISNISSFIKKLKKSGWWVIGLDAEGTQEIRNFFNKNKKLKKILLVFGSEGYGLGKLTKQNCDFLIKIPHNLEQAESLNVSNACSITFYEMNSKDSS
ncbi:23S rRNA (guanosine(2251)-2'-O)-methyltransferase RlmB [Alphaproteobacteria bacterium]|nr:23S rRNA (guanosine(2251)-2'-O)-methyltransferase RlmB [Alphaproteobacteria bacterium]